MAEETEPREPVVAATPPSHEARHAGFIHVTVREKSFFDGVRIRLEHVNAAQIAV